VETTDALGPEQIAELSELEARATRGPWRYIAALRNAAPTLMSMQGRIVELESAHDALLHAPHSEACCCPSCEGMRECQGRIVELEGELRACRRREAVLSLGVNAVPTGDGWRLDWDAADREIIEAMDDWRDAIGEDQNDFLDVPAALNAAADALEAAGRLEDANV